MITRIPSSEQSYEVRAFYLDGAMAFHTWNIGDVSRDLEITAARSRKDIGRVQWRTRGFDWQDPPEVAT